MSSDPLDFLASVFDGDKPTVSWRPYVTLTFAQSLDAKIAGANGKQLILSGKESMIMTHWMRTMHDGILIGIGTALNDDPQLNTRHLPERAGVRSKPRPVILDTNLRLSGDCKLLKNYREGRGRRPWVLCSNSLKGSSRVEGLEKSGARVIAIESERNDVDGLDMTAVLTRLRTYGMERLMVEGGAKIIATFLNRASYIDAVIITTAPVIVGSDGRGYDTCGIDVEITGRAELGRDGVVVLRPVRRLEGDRMTQ